MLVVVCALCAIAVASASATEVLFALSKGTFPATFTSKGGKAKLQTLAGNTVECQTVTDKGTIGSATEGKGETAHLGSSEVKFKECETESLLGKVTCQTGSTSGEIVITSAEFHLGLTTISSTHVPAILFLLPEGSSVENPLGGKFKFKCSVGKVEVTGDVVGTLENSIGKFKKTANVEFAQSTGGKQNTTEFLLSLTKPENELMTGQHLTTKTTIFSTETSESGETTIDTLEGFENSKK
ncbi:MAG TPA: hypothetical protein VMU32_01880, partial [Solirubrobacteraceae bacterium]|nr:hypothetical protein [Solirubrobacteraceae bacterium]